MRRVTVPIRFAVALVVVTMMAATPAVGAAQHTHTVIPDDAPSADGKADGMPSMSQSPHEMWMQPLGDGWTLTGMAQAIPTLSGGDPLAETLDARSWQPYLTQPAAMFDVASRGARVVLRTTLNFEALTQRDGELTYGAWGEGFLDSRHPHTLLHEVMLSFNAWDTRAGSFSLSAGKGFAPYGTDDPMARPAEKYPTNHHLSQILERWTLNAQYLTRGGMSLEAGLFAGAEPSGPYDLGGISGFGNSWSARVTQRFGAGFGPSAPWELSLSYASVAEEHQGVQGNTKLANVALRHSGPHRFGSLYALAEASRSWPDEGDGYYSVLGETRLGLGSNARHRPYYRVEYATRPEYEREGVPGTDGFFRYDHDAHAIGSTRWLINTVGYGYELSRSPVSARPYLELQHNRIWPDRGAVGPRALFGATGFWSMSLGVRLFFGGGPMRMGSYGLLDPMAATARPGAVMEHGDSSHGSHQSH